MTHLNELASIDSFTNPHEKVNFFYNSDKDCREEHDLDPKKPGIAMNLLKNTPLAILNEKSTNAKSV